MRMEAPIAATMALATAISGDFSSTLEKQPFVEQPPETTQSSPFDQIGNKEKLADLPQVADSVQDMAIRKEIISLIQGRDADPENFILRNDGWRILLKDHDEQSIKRFLDFLVEKYPSKKDGQAVTREQALSGFLQMELNPHGDTGKFVERFGQIQQVMDANQYDDMSRVIHAARELGYTKILPIENLTPVWIEILKDPKQLSAHIFIRQVASFNTARTIEAAGLVPEGRRFYELTPVEQMKVYITYQQQQRSVKKPAKE